ncbi:hypothetical protein RhiXN_01821 [Rhizoctonia solani]|uniref:Uncharacterized protein n=1 Tax=Rhizoctonia solani TaxID=456999 RepID=A0A8H8P7X7_9AGAM|nr:uncharacterized protein RhiXN_01821 [Rhizoctonia solani]QRW27226.1 hypothetical protein RhiXN_01821 [Rhizoctonia solani]
MKYLTYRTLATIIFTLVYLLLLELNFIHLPSGFGERMQHNSNYSSELTPGNSSLLPVNSTLHYPLSYSVWFQSSWHHQLIRTRSRLHLAAEAVSINPYSGPQKIVIEGLWKQHLARLGAADLNLSSVVILTSPSIMAEGIQSSPANGYINSRIDLRRRRRAFSALEDEITPPSNALWVRKETVEHPMSVDPSALREEFEKGAIKNKLLKEALASRKLRKGQKEEKLQSQPNRIDSSLIVMYIVMCAIMYY